jgi:hypothetical protein
MARGHFRGPLNDEGLAICHANVLSGIVTEDRALAPGVRRMREALNALPLGAAGTVAIK